MSKIQSEDIQSVAKSLNIQLSNEQVEKILVEYPAAQKEEPTSTWNEVVENLIYQYSFY